MALLQNEYVKYDSDRHFYYLTEAGLAEYVTNGEEKVDLWDGAHRLKLQARLLHNKYIASAYNGNYKRFRHRDLVEYAVFKDENGERDAIIEALTNFAEVVGDSELDRNILDGTAQFPESILQPLYDVGVYFRGRICGEVPEDEYEVGY